SPSSSLSFAQHSTPPSTIASHPYDITGGAERLSTMGSMGSGGYGGHYSGGGQDYSGSAPYNPAMQHIRSASGTSHLSPHSRPNSMAAFTHSRNASGASARTVGTVN